MSSRTPTNSLRDVPHNTISRRHLLAAGGAVAIGSLAGCLNQVASSVTNTGASPAAVFAGMEWNDDEREVSVEMARWGPHVSRLTPTLSGRVELEGWVTSSAIIAANYNNSRSNRSTIRASDGDADSDGDGVGDADEDDDLVAYLGGKPIVGERFTVCLPDAAVPGGNGSIAEAVTPERLIQYLTGQFDGDGRVYSWETPKAGPGDPDPSNDCNDDGSSVYPGAVCGTTPHFVAEVSGPTATGGSLEVVRAEDGTVFVRSSNEAAAGDVEILMTLTADPLVAGPDGDGSDTSCSAGDDRCGPGKWARTTESGSGSGVSVYQVLVQPPECPRPFPALLYVQRFRSDDQLIYTGGWVIDDAAIYENSATVLSLAGPTQVVGIECCFDYDSDREHFGDVVKRSVSGERALRGARIDSGTVEKLVKAGVLSAEGFDPEDPVVSDFLRSRSGGESGGQVMLTHVAVDAPVLHLVGASRVSQDVKFKAGAELSKAVN